MTDRNVGFGEAPSLFLKNYANFQGRSSRGAFWWWVLVSLLAGFVLGFIDGMLFSGMMMSGGLPIGPLGGLWSLATLVGNISLGIRRLHDTNKSGWWLLLGFIPIIGAIVLIVFYIGEGTKGDNKFGPDVEAGRA